MGNGPQLTTQTLKVLGVLLDTTMEPLSGAEIGKATTLRSGTLYPILARLENAGWVKSSWEEGDPCKLGRPRRRFYEITGIGARGTKAAFKELAATVGGLAWTS
jgi:PadR family transcriptional regulator, regulatory protein PadR